MSKFINWEIRPVETLLFIGAIVGVFISTDRRLTRLEEQQANLRERIAANDSATFKLTDAQQRIAENLARIDARQRIERAERTEK